MITTLPFFVKYIYARKYEHSSFVFLTASTIGTLFGAFAKKCHPITSLFPSICRLFFTFFHPIEKFIYRAYPVAGWPTRREATGGSRSDKKQRTNRIRIPTPLPSRDERRLLSH